VTQEKRHRRGFVLTIALVVVAGFVGFVALHARWRATTSAPDARSPASGVVASSSAASKPEGEAPPAPLGNDSSISGVPLPIILTATMPGRNASEGSALLGVNRDSPQTYIAGALLANGARLAEIHSQYVVIEKDGHSTRLYLQGAQPRSAPQPLKELTTVGGARDFKPAAITNADTLTDYIRPSPVYEGQALKGYEVYPGQKSGLFMRLGLRGGDIITMLNDAPFSDPGQAIDLFRQIADGAVMTATLERQGKIERLTLDGSVIANAELAPGGEARRN
jgi:type II secretion system protein C